MKYILRTLWLIGLIPILLLAGFLTIVYGVIGFPIVLAFIFIKTGIFDDNRLLPTAIGEWILDKYYSLLDKIK